MFFCFYISYISWGCAWSRPIHRCIRWGPRPARRRGGLGGFVPDVHYCTTADRIWMRFEMDPWMRQVVGFGDRSTGWLILGAKMGRRIVTNGEFAA